MGENNIRSQFTELSARQWDYLLRETLTPRQAVAFLKSGLPLRTFPDNLRRLYGGEDVQERLIAGMTEYAGMDEKPVREDSVRRKVQNWMKNKKLPSDREEIFRIAFALGFDEHQTDDLLLGTVEQGIHYRNPREVVYAFSLRNHQSYQTARANADLVGGYRKDAGREQAAATRILRLEFENLPPGEDIMNFLMCHSEKLGFYHNTAWQYFMKMLGLLTEGGADEEEYSIEYVTETYLRMNMPLERRTASYSDIQKIIKKYWPGVRSIKGMRNRTEDVTRKVLLLLYLITGGIRDGKYDELDEDYIPAGEILEEHCRRLNWMMEECGMRRMDPRSPFDYLVLYCLMPRDGDDMSASMKLIIAELFEL